MAKLLHVFGRSRANGVNCIDVSESSHCVAYVAGSSIVIRSFLDGKEHFLLSDTASAFTCLTLSPCGKYLAAGESGTSTCVTIHELFDPSGNFSGAQIARLRTDTIISVKFIPNSPLLIAVADATSAQLSVWRWREERQMSCSKLAAHVICSAISPDGQLLVTAGERHLKYWNVPGPDEVEITSRTAILAERRSSTFVGCAFVADNRLLAVTSDGVVVEFFNKKFVNSYQWKEASPTCITTTVNSVLLGCSDGSVQRLLPTDLSPLGSLPKPLPVDVDPSTITTIESLSTESAIYSPVSCIAASYTSGVIVSLHEDSSLFIHEQSNNEWKRLYSELAHNSRIHAVIVPSPQCSLFPNECFITGGADGSIRFWCLPNAASTNSVFTTGNLVSPYLRKSIFLSPPESETEEKLHVEVICLALAPNGHFMAAGTSTGFLQLYDTSTTDVLQIESFAAHDSEVTCVAFSSYGNGEVMACGGRDHFVHVFRAALPTYQHCFTLCDHANNISAIEFAEDDNGVLIFSASERLILIHKFADIHSDTISVQRVKELVVPWSTLSLCYSPGSPMLAACSDRQIRTISLKGETMPTAIVCGDGETIESMSVDGSNSFALTTCADKMSYITELRSGNCAATLNVQNPIAAVILNDFKRVVVVTDDGCVQIWRLASALVSTMTEAKKLQMQRLRSNSPDSLLGSGSEFSEDQHINIAVGTDFGSEESVLLNQKPLVLPTSSFEKQLPSSSLLVQPAQVTRRSTGNLANTHLDVSSPDVPDSTQSDFISVRSEPRSYQPSKSMTNIYGDIAVVTPKRRSARSKWGEPQPQDPTMYGRMSMTPMNVRMNIDSTPSYPSRVTPSMQNINSTQRQLAEVAASIQNNSTNVFRRNSEIRSSLSRRCQESGENRSLWTPQSLATRRSPSKNAIYPLTPKNDAVITTSAVSGRTMKAIPLYDDKPPRSRKADDLLSQVSSSPQQPSYGSPMAPSSGSRERTMNLKKRTDSDMSYTTHAGRLTKAPSSNLNNSDLRKSTEALNRIAALRQQMNKSTENLRKSTDRLDMPSSNSSSMYKARSITNLRSTQLEMGESFTADEPRGLYQSRELAQSFSNLKSPDPETLERLQQSLSLLKKASNPDLTQEGLFDDALALSGEKMRRRGAVQKKVERFHPRNRARPQTSEESDSNTSDVGQLHKQPKWMALVGSRSADNSARLGLTNKHVFEQKKPSVANSPRKSNYITQKLNNDELTGPDLGSDDSPRSSINASDWPNLLEDNSECQKLLKHVQDCCDQYIAHTDRLLQARKMIESSSLNSEQKRMISSQISRVTEISNEKLSGKSKPMADSNGNDYHLRTTRIKPLI